MKSRVSSEILEFLRGIDLFRGLSDKALRQLAENIEERSFINHEYIYQKGSISENLYIIRYGEVMIQFGEVADIIRYLGPGDVLAENSILTGSTHLGSAYAVLDSKLYVLDGKYFLKMAEKNQILSQNLVKLIGGRMRDHLSGAKKSVNRRLVAHIQMEPVQDFRKKIENIVSIGKISAPERVKVVNIASYRRYSRDKAMYILAEMKKQFPIIHIYSDDPELLREMDYLVMQCDQIVFWETDTARFINQKTSIINFWNSRIRNFAGRAVRYVDSRKKQYIENLMEGQRYYTNTDIMARYLVTKTRGLALGGGGARALAHVGLLKVLDKENIKIDYISGASMGAVIAALYARGESSESLEKLVLKFFGGLSNPFDQRLPLVSFFSGKNIKQMLKSVFGNELIEDFPMTFVTSAVDLETGEEYVFDRGPVWEALACAVSLPGAFPPYFMGRHMLIDGGVVNNVPDDLIRKKGADIVLGVNVSPLRDHGLFKLLEDHNNSGISWFRKMWENLKYPPILKIMGRAITIEGRELLKLKKNTVDLFVHFHMEKFSLFDFGRHKDIIKAGELQAKENISEIRALFFPKGRK